MSPTINTAFAKSHLLRWYLISGAACVCPSKPQNWRLHQPIPSLPSPPTANHNLAADNEDRTTIQKNAWLWRLRTCPNCTCRFSFPGADGHWLRCTCRRPVPCLSVTYFVLGVQALACSTSCSACDDIFFTSLTSQ